MTRHSWSSHFLKGELIGVSLWVWLLVVGVSSVDEVESGRHDEDVDHTHDHAMEHDIENNEVSRQEVPIPSRPTRPPRPSTRPLHADTTNDAPAHADLEATPTAQGPRPPRPVPPRPSMPKNSPSLAVKQTDGHSLSSRQSPEPSRPPTRPGPPRPSRPPPPKK